MVRSKDLPFLKYMCSSIMVWEVSYATLCALKGKMDDCLFWLACTGFWGARPSPRPGSFKKSCAAVPQIPLENSVRSTAFHPRSGSSPRPSNVSRLEIEGNHGNTHRTLKYGCMDASMPGCMDVWMYGCMDVWMYEWMDVWMSGCLDEKSQINIYIYIHTHVYSAYLQLTWKLPVYPAPQPKPSPPPPPATKKKLVVVWKVCRSSPLPRVHGMIWHLCCTK